MDRKQFGAVLDETVSQMEHDVTVLKNRRVTLETNVKELEKMRDDLSNEIADLEEKHSKTIKENEVKATSILSKAQEKMNQASSTGAEATKKLAELNEKIKNSDNLIKTNKGLKNTLDNSLAEIKSQSEKLVKLVGTINDTLEKL